MEQIRHFTVSSLLPIKELLIYFTLHNDVVCTFLRFLAMALLKNYMKFDYFKSNSDLNPYCSYNLCIFLFLRRWIFWR